MPAGGPRGRPGTVNPRASSPAVAARMAAQRRRDTAPEVALRRLLHRAGARYRVEHPVPGMPRRTVDIAFTRQRVAVFVDGCFWHGCPDHSRPTRSNTGWWADKLAANGARDRSTTAHLEAAGWTVLRVWEHEEPAVAAGRVLDVLRCRRAS